MNEKTEKKKWIFPPGLTKTRQEFEALFAALYRNADRRKPLMLMADRGAGKSAFLDIFKGLYLNRHPAVKTRRLNVSALPETLLVSELFGHRKGTFTDAKTDKRGHLETLGDGGLLMLEEIGDISQEIQAKLLTVIEDGEFFPVGETEKPRHARNIQIVGTTNKPRESFRQDFFDRFFYFPIPALHERRQDALPYLRHFLGGGMADLSRFDLLAIMAYHWPGNVRGVEKLADAIMWRAALREQGSAFIPRHLGVLNWEHDLSTIHGHKALQKNLAKFNLSLEPGGARAFKGKVPDTFEREYEGLCLFCEYTGQDINANYNLLNLTDKAKPQEFDIAELNHNELQKKYLRALLQRAGGNKAEAARKAGLNDRTFRSMLKRYEI